MSFTPTTTTSVVHLPLTTTFTPDPSCLSTYVSNGTNTAFFLGPISGSACYPSGWALTGTNYFSPGLCPSGYVGATTSLNSINTIVETIVDCCPAGYEYVESAFITNYHCTQTFISFTPVTALKVDGGSTVQTVDSYAFGGGVNAPSVQVRWQSTDFQVSSTFSGSTFSGPTSSGPTSSGPTSSGPTSSGSALSQSRVGISIGLPLGILLLISMLITIIVWRRTRKTRHFQSDHATGLSSNDPSSAFSGVFKAELPALMS